MRTLKAELLLIVYIVAVGFLWYTWNHLGDDVREHWAKVAEVREQRHQRWVDYNRLAYNYYVIHIDEQK